MDLLILVLLISLEIKFLVELKIAGPIFAQFFVLSLYCRYQVIDILFLFVFDSEIVDDKGE